MVSTTGGAHRATTTAAARPTRVGCRAPACQAPTTTATTIAAAPTAVDRVLQSFKRQHAIAGIEA